ncbi:hypothetical protein LCGC14_1325370 [marine sediment metagenome]|uniref:Uncharacterized protein n=1 Tax=marine sediment metagenome TaxID=412755 RepID=A0A0F9KIV3_9ZZZZ
MNKVAIGNKMAENFLGFGYHESIKMPLHRKTIRSKEKQFLNWSLNRYPVTSEFRLLTKFFLEREFISINNIPHRLQFRKFLNDGTSIHFSLWKKHYGFNIDAHIDLSPHGDVKFTPTTLRLLSELYIHLKKKYGSVFLFPREKNKYQGYVSKHLPWERVNRKKNRPKRRLR